MHFCLLSQPALYLVSSLLGQVGALPFFQAVMAGTLSSPPPALLSPPVHGVHSREAGAVHAVVRWLSLAMRSEHVTRPLCFFGYHEFSTVCLLSLGLIFSSYNQDPRFCFWLYFLGD